MGLKVYGLEVRDFFQCTICRFAVKGFRASEFKASKVEWDVERLMVKILHYLKDPKLWELWYIPYYG